MEQLKEKYLLLMGYLDIGLRELGSNILEQKQERAVSSLGLFVAFGLAKFDKGNLNVQC